MKKLRSSTNAPAAERRGLGNLFGLTGGLKANVGGKADAKPLMVGSVEQQLRFVAEHADDLFEGSASSPQARASRPQVANEDLVLWQMARQRGLVASPSRRGPQDQGHRGPPPARAAVGGPAPASDEPKAR